MGLNLSVGLLDIILNFQQKSMPSYLFFVEEYLKDRRWCTSSWINIFFNFFARSLGFFVSWLWWQFCKSSGEWIKVLATAHFQPTSADTLISTKAKDFCKLITSPFNNTNTLWYSKMPEHYISTIPILFGIQTTIHRVCWKIRIKENPWNRNWI